MRSMSNLTTRRLWALLLITCCGCALYPPGPVTHRYDLYSASCNAPFGNIEAAKSQGNADCAPVTPVSNDLDQSIRCAQTTRDVYGGFLVCREWRQLAAGGAIALLAAGAAGVAAAG